MGRLLTGCHVDYINFTIATKIANFDSYALYIHMFHINYGRVVC